MKLTEKFEHIANWTFENVGKDINKINQKSGEKDFPEIEKRIGEKLPEEFTEIYSKFNGEIGNSYGVLFGLGFITTEKIILELEFSLNLMKPKERKIVDKNNSEKILSEISDLYFKSIPKKKKFGLFTIKWIKAKFNCSHESHSGITVEYENGDSENYSLNNSISERVFTLGKKLHSLEEKDYNWDSLEFELLPNGTYNVEREDYIWENEIDFSSCPENFIRKKYFHFKWLPIFQDFGGNFIGIDLDPENEGTKGQIIIYGRDEEKMVVLAKNLEEFLDLSIKEMKDNPNQFKTENHIHEVYKKIKNCA